jgi:hypothetical protein
MPMTMGFGHRLIIISKWCCPWEIRNTCPCTGNSLLFFSTGLNAKVLGNMSYLQWNCFKTLSPSSNWASNAMISLSTVTLHCGVLFTSLSSMVNKHINELIKQANKHPQPSLCLELGCIGSHMTFGKFSFSASLRSSERLPLW